MYDYNEYRNKMRIEAVGRVSGKRISIMCVENNKIYNSLKEAADELNLFAGNISSVLSGKLKSTGRLSFKKI